MVDRYSEIHEVADRVDSKETFLEFVAALRADLEASRIEENPQPSSPYSAAAGGWENSDLGRFLAAMHAWTEDMGDRIEPQPSWRMFADMLMAAKIYE
jgi:hypothetical protein